MRKKIKLKKNLKNNFLLKHKNIYSFITYKNKSDSFFFNIFINYSLSFEQTTYKLNINIITKNIRLNTNIFLVCKKINNVEYILFAYVYIDDNFLKTLEQTFFHKCQLMSQKYFCLKHSIKVAFIAPNNLSSILLDFNNIKKELNIDSEKDPNNKWIYDLTEDVNNSDSKNYFKELFTLNSQYIDDFLLYIYDFDLETSSLLIKGIDKIDFIKNEIVTLDSIKKYL